MSHFTYVYDGWKLIDEPRHEGDAALDSLQANPYSDGGDRLPGRKRSQYDPLGTEEAYYVQGPGADEPLTRNPTIGQISYYNQDGNGNVTALTDASGNVIEHYAYDPFGNVTITSSTGMVMSSSSVGNRFMFTGREYIAEIGLYDYRNRVYSPGLGRFLQTDPLRFQAGDINIYKYVGNNPIKWVDPFGLFTIGIGLQGSGNLIQGAGGVSVGYYIGWSPQDGFSHGVLRSADGGSGLGLGRSGGGFLQVTGAGSVCELKGIGFSIGGSGREGPSFGGEFLGGLDGNDNATYNGFQLNVGVGAGIPAEVHSTISYTQ